MKKWIVVFLLIIVFTSCTSSNSSNEEKNRVVFFGRVFVETSYELAEYPLNETEIVLVANQYSVLWPRITNIYYWALTNDWKSDIKTLDQPVGEKLQILQNNRLIDTLSMQEYVVQIENGDTIRLFLGKDAINAHEFFQKQYNQYINDLTAYSEEYSAYKKAISAAFIQAQSTGIPVDPASLPPLPEKPSSFPLMSSKPALGFPINLPAGEYEINLLGADNQMIEGGSRKLRIIEPLNTTIAYKIIPESRWTKPEWSYDINANIYLHEGEVVYLSPFLMREYYLRDWLRIKNPQQILLSGDAKKWVTVGDLTEGTILETSANELVSMERYRVVQNSGYALGYQIIPKPQDDERAPDIIGYRIEGPAPGGKIRVGLVDGLSILPDSTRIIMTVNTNKYQILVWLLTLLPIGVSLSYGKMKWRRSGAKFGTDGDK